MNESTPETAAAAVVEVEVENHLPIYNKIIITLTVATGIEFGIAALITPGDAADSTIPFAVGVLLLVAVAAYKAYLVAKIFMHLKYDPKLLGWIIFSPIILGTPLVLFCTYDAIMGPSPF